MAYQDASMDVIGERKLVFRPTGQEHEREILLRLGRHQQRLEDGWEVEIEIVDPDKSWKLPPVWGADGLGAILLGGFALSRYIEWYTMRGKLVCRIMATQDSRSGHFCCEPEIRRTGESA